MLDRFVTQIEPPLDHIAKQPPQAFCDFLSGHTIILLGDPGVGKTHLFQHAARHEEAEYTTVRHFVLFEGEHCEGKTVYLDALDEFRSRSDNQDTVVELVRILRGLGRPKMRLSCRAADWLGNTDLQIFRQLAQDNSFVVLHLEPLTEAQILHIAQSYFPDDAQHFYQEAMDRGLEALITNPQTLLMLLRVVAGGIWPRTREELYERSATFLLTEPNEEHTRKSLGQFEAAELLDAAGAASAAILISGLPGLSLRPNSLDADYRSYRHIPFDNPQKVEAALCRRAFVTVADEQVTYSHRTVAEFLAARWLAKKLQQGLPLGRIQSLLCVEGVPAPELRGLHAWLATLSPDHAPVLIGADPYGVLVYGDAASMSPSLRKAFLTALQKLAQVDPWFRATDWTDKPLGGLSGPEMVEDFQSILMDVQSGPHLRSVVLDAIKNGPEVPALRDTLRSIFADNCAPYPERIDAFEALLHVIPGGMNDIVSVYRHHLIGDRSTARLRACVLAKLYPADCTTNDIVAVFEDILNDSEGPISSELWELMSAIKEPYLPEVISALCALNIGEACHSQRQNNIEAAGAFTHLLERFFVSNLPKQPQQIWPWLCALYHCKENIVDNRTIKVWLHDNPSFVLAMFDSVIEQISNDEIIGLVLYDFFEIIGGSIAYDALAVHCCDLLETKHQYNEKDHEIYQSALRLCFQCDCEAIGLFERLYALGNCNHALAKKRDVLCVCQIEEWRREHQHRRQQYIREKDLIQAQNQRNLCATAASVRTGQHLPNLRWLAQIYFGLVVGSATDLDSVTRLKNVIGDDLTQVALEGFQALLWHPDLPSPQYIAELKVNNRYYRWWDAILAGMDVRWGHTRCLDPLPETTMEAALCWAFEFRNTGRPPNRGWVEHILTERPALAHRVFGAFLYPLLESKVSHISLLSELASNAKTQPWGSTLALELLAKFPSAPSESLRHLLYAALLEESSWKQLPELAKNVLATRGRVRGAQRVLWMVTGYLLSPEDFQRILEKYLSCRKEALWTVKEFVEQSTSAQESHKLPLTVEQRQFFALLIGRHFENVYRPTGKEMTSDHNDWEAPAFVRWQVETLSGDPSEEAGAALVALEGNPRLISYRDHLRHAIANHAKIRRQHQYTQPDWDKTVETLRGGQPANIADLYALVSAHLRTLCSEIRHSNIDIYKQFWDLSPQLGSIQRPQHEEVCRDRLIGLLRPRLSPLDIAVEPEGHMAADKRADIVLYHGSDLKLPIEVKRHTHKDLWTACENQLDRLYAHDPHAAGFGIYLVFWFGEDRGGGVPAPLPGVTRPDSAVALEQALRSRIPEDKAYCLDVIVLDVTPPAATKKTQVKSGRYK